MRAENFSWLGGIYVVVEGQELDLHNCYDFSSFTHSVSNRLLCLTWHRGAGEWVDKSLPPGLAIEFSDVQYLKVVPRDPKKPFTEDDCLSSFGYICDESWGLEQFSHDGTPDPDWRWSFYFESGAEIIVGAKRARVVLHNLEFGA